jgi:peptidoglycan pentaglycine glycine transferase (the first glycine)
MYGFITPERYKEYDDFVSSHPKGHFMQTRKWAAVKTAWTWDAVIVERDGKICGGLAALFRRLPCTPFTIMYCCRGPVCDIHDYELLSELLDGAKALAKKHRSYIIKADPDVLSSEEKFADCLRAAGFSPAGDNKNFEGAQPRYVFRLNVEGKTAEKLLESFESKTRYNIRLAARRGVEVKVCGKEECPTFARLMKETGERDNFIVRGEKYFEKLLTAMGENARLYMAYHENEAIAGALAIHFGDKVWYLYGASANVKRNLMPNYLLQFEMIKWAVEEKCKIYDFRGISGDLSENNPLYGLYRFKKGFNGDFCEFIGEYELLRMPFIKKLELFGREIRRFLGRIRGFSGTKASLSGKKEE